VALLCCGGSVSLEDLLRLTRAQEQPRAPVAKH
jgi:hypothetical protein